MDDPTDLPCPTHHTDVSPVLPPAHKRGGPATGVSLVAYPEGVARAERTARGSWLAGPAVRPGGYPGERLGLPESGRGAIAGLGARSAALLIDAALGYLVGAGVSILFGIKVAASCGPGAQPPGQPICPAVARAGFDRSLVISGAFLVLVAVGLALAGRTVGMRAANLQLVRLDGRRIGWRAVPRTALMALLVPVLLTDRDGRGLHDRASGTALVRTR